MAVPIFRDSIVPRFDLLDKLCVFQSKGFAVDMCMKSVVYLARLLNVLVGKHDLELRDRLETLVLSIIDFRMLVNAWRYVNTFKCFVETMLHRNEYPPSMVLCMALMFWFRTFEQIWGDLGYLQKNAIPSLRRERTSWHFKFNKSISLTFAACLEMLRIFRYRNLRSDHIDQHSSPTNITSPNEHSDSEVDYDREIFKSSVFLFRNVLDMIVYYQWIPWYRPWKWLSYSCGTVSGVLGVYMIWEDTKPTPATPRRIL